MPRSMTGFARTSQQYDWGTLTGSITCGCVALYDAVNFLRAKKAIKQNPIKQLIGSVSVGMYQGVPVLDLDYAEDSTADTDMNVVMNEAGRFIEVQGTAENGDYDAEQLQQMIALAQKGIAELVVKQKQVLGLL